MFFFHDGVCEVDILGRARAKNKTIWSTGLGRVDRWLGKEGNSFAQCKKFVAVYARCESGGAVMAGREKGVGEDGGGGRGVLFRASGMSVISAIAEAAETAETRAASVINF